MKYDKESQTMGANGHVGAKGIHHPEDGTNNLMIILMH